MPISHTSVARCYRYLLGRDPESDLVVSRKARGCRNIWELIEEIVKSPEYRNRVDQTAPPLSLDVPAGRIDMDASSADLEALRQIMQRGWERLGRDEPYRSVITASEHKGAPESAGTTGFWASGEAIVGSIVRILARHGMDALGDKTCIDLGCGVGRLTAPLANRFHSVHGYDVSSTHLDVARRQLARHTNVELTRVAALPLRLPRADVVVSLIVLQHNPPPIIGQLIEAALACLEPGGIALFQVPTYEPGYTFDLASYLDTHRQQREAAGMEMHCIPQRQVFAIVAAAGCHVLEVREDNLTGRWGKSVSNTFMVGAPAR